jgi:hypothetical protein
MEYVDGVNLRQAMRAGRLSAAEVLRIVPRICEALQFAHDEGVLHRDIKPENILLDARGRVKIADFGIAKLVGEAKPDLTLTRSGAAVGTPQYMAPEQIERPSEVDHRADIYSLGVVFYEMLTGELPIGRFTAPSEKTPLDQRIDEIVLRALAKERELRQQSATEVRTQIENLATTPSPPVAPGTPGQRGPVGSISDGSQGGRVGAADDFILLNPRLPRMARAITLYAILGAPLLWLLGLLMQSPEPPASHPTALRVQQLTAFLLGTCRPIAVLMLVVGGFKLRGLRPEALRWIRQGVWVHVGLVALRIVGAAWIDALDRRAGTPTFTPWETALALLAIGSIGWEVSMLVWLGRHGPALCRILGLPAPGEPAPHATPAALWTGFSLGLALVLTGVLLAGPQVAAWQWNESRPLHGLGEIPTGLLGLVVLGTGLKGWLAGRRALFELREGRGRFEGVKRAVFASAAWPVVLVMGLTTTGGALALLQLAVPGYVPILIALGVSLGAGEIVLRRSWRRAVGEKRGPGEGRVPGWIHRWVLGGQVIAVAVVVPVTMLWL